MFRFLRLAAKFAIDISEDFDSRFFHRLKDHENLNFFCMNEKNCRDTLKHSFFFFFYGGSLMDMASQTAWRNSPLSSACLPASTIETPIHSPMSCVHLLLGLPLPLLPSHVPSKNSFSNMLCRLMWPKYDSFCFLIRFKSCGAFTPSCSRILAFVFLSVYEILSIFL